LTAIEGLFADGRVADLILLVLALEAAWLLTRPANRSRTAALDVVTALAPGACLVLALRGALTGADWRLIGLALAASLPAHLIDLQRRRPGRR
jgi:hypothetical protein